MKILTVRLLIFILMSGQLTILTNGFAEDSPIGVIARIDTGEGPINAIAYSRVVNRLAVAAADNIRIYDTSTYEEIKVLVGHTDSVLVLTFSPNGKLLLSGSVNVLTLHVKRKTLATGSVDNTIQLWDIKEDTEAPYHITQSLHILVGHTGNITAMDFSVSGELLASASSDKTVRLWDVVTGQHLHTLTGHITEIRAVTFLGDKALAGMAFAEAKALASGSADGTVFIWDLDRVVSTD